jgi:hypothetical protein
VDPESIFGSQAFLLSRETAIYVVKHWDSVEGMQDIKMSRLAARLAEPVFYHAPSLVQHVGRKSTWGGGFHRARDYDRYWKFCGPIRANEASTSERPTETDPSAQVA